MNAATATYTPRTALSLMGDINSPSLVRLLDGEELSKERRHRFIMDLLPTAVQVLREEEEFSIGLVNANTIFQAWLRDNPGATASTVEEALAADED